MSRSTGDSEHDAFIEKTRLFWSERAGREISTEDAREISERMYEFISILVRWDKQDKLKKTFLNQLMILLKSRMK